MTTSHAPPLRGPAQHLWAKYPDIITQVGERFTGVLIEHKPAVHVMHAHDAATTLHLIDPPYLHSTRVIKPGKSRGYRHEMTDFDHMNLLDSITSLTGMVVLCGYPSRLYENALRSWHRYQTSSRAAAQRGSATRTEVIWLNPACRRALGTPELQASLL